MSPNVIVVEDDEDLLFLYKTALEQRGFTVAEARNTAKVLELLNTPGFIPALIILDIEMPDVPGTKVVDYIRNDERFSATKIMVITANENYRDRIGDEVSEFVVKPIAVTDLLQLADRLTA